MKRYNKKEDNFKEGLSQMEDKSKTKKHWLVLAVVSLMYAGTLGLVNNTIGIYYTPVSRSLDILVGSFAMNATISSIATGVASLFAPRMLERLGWKKTITLGASLAFIGIFGMGLTTSVALFNLLGAMRGIGVAFAAMVPSAAIINNWFEEKNGLAISIMTSFSGVGSVVFSPIFSRLIETIGWQNTFLVHGAFVLILCLPAIFIPYTFTPQEEGLFPYGAKPKDLNQDERDVEKLKPVRTNDFIGLTFFAFVAVAFLQTFVVGLNQHLPGYGDSLGMTTQITGFMLSGVMFGNMSFKLITGTLSDKLGEIRAMLIVVGLNISSLILLSLWTSPTGLIFNSWLFGSIFGTAVLYVLLAKRFFGIRVGNYVYSYTTFAANIAAALSNVLIGYIYDFTGTYLMIFWGAIAIQIIAVILLFVAFKYAPAEQ